MLHIVRLDREVNRGLQASGSPSNGHLGGHSVDWERELAASAVISSDQLSLFADVDGALTRHPHPLATASQANVPRLLQLGF